jgi:hypothetical protein
MGRAWSLKGGGIWALGQLVGWVEYPAVTMAIRQFEKPLQVDKKFANPLNRVLKMLQVKTGPLA